jgi:hypothetical protein
MQIIQIIATVLLAYISFVQAYSLVENERLEQRVQYCRENSYECAVHCPSAPPAINSCDPETMKWDCQCAGFTAPKVSYSQFKISYYQCNGELDECVEDCLKAITPDRNTCSAKCKDDKKCGTASARQSETFRVDNRPKSPSSPSQTSGSSKKSMAAFIVFFYFLAQV